MIEKYSKLFKSKFIDKSYFLNEITKNKICIIIYTNDGYNKDLQFLQFNCLKRKNCWVLKPNDLYNKIYIFFHENYIQSIIRQKLLNTLLND